MKLRQVCGFNKREPWHSEIKPIRTRLWVGWWLGDSQVYLEAK